MTKPTMITISAWKDIKAGFDDDDDGDDGEDDNDDDDDNICGERYQGRV